MITEIVPIPSKAARRARSGTNLWIRALKKVSKAGSNLNTCKAAGSHRDPPEPAELETILAPQLRQENPPRVALTFGAPSTLTPQDPPR